MKVCAHSGVYNLSQMEELTYTPTSSNIFGIPMEKLRPRHETKEFLFLRNNYTPILTNNQVYSKVYYGEIAAFVEAVERRRTDILSPLPSLKTTYKILSNLVTIIETHLKYTEKTISLQTL